MRLGYKYIVYLVILILAFGGTAIYGMKVNSQTETSGPTQVEPLEVVLVWVDCDARLNENQLLDLTRSVRSTGARLYSAIFSPNKDYIWFLVETEFDKVSELANNENVLNVSVAEETGWKWDHWWHYQKISPGLRLQVKRMETEFPGERVEVYLSFKITSDLETARNNIIELVEGLGGTVTRIGYAEYMEVLMPPNTVELLATHDIIYRIYPIGPLIPE